MTRSTFRCKRFMLALVSAGLVYLAVAAGGVQGGSGDSCTATADGDALVPERYVTRRSDPYDINDSDPDVNCTLQGNDSVSCPAPGRLFDEVELSDNAIETRHLFHHWQSSGSGEYAEVELVFRWPVSISTVTWSFWQNVDYPNISVPPSATWNVTAVPENGIDVSRIIIVGGGASSQDSYHLEMDNISGFPAARHWRVIIPLPDNKWLFLFEVAITGKVDRLVPQTYSITESAPFNGVNPDDGSNCSTVDGGMVECNTSGSPRLFDCLKPNSVTLPDNEICLFHLWYRATVQLVLTFQEPVIIDKIVWTFYYSTSTSPKITGTVTQWNVTALDENDEGNTTAVDVTSVLENQLQTYTMVVQDSVAARKWSVSFRGENDWLFLSEVDIAGSNAEPPTTPSPSTTAPSSTVTSGVGMSTPSLSPTPSTTASPSSSSPGSPLAGGDISLYTIIGILAGVICLLILCVLTVILALVLKMRRARRYNAAESGKGTPGPEAVYSEIPPQDFNSMPLVNKLPGYPNGRQSNSYLGADYANSETIEKVNSGRVSPVYDDPEKYRITDLSRSMPMIARLTAPQDWIANQTRCRTLSPPAWYRDSDAGASMGSASSLPPGCTNAFTASPSTGQENTYHELQPSDGEDSEDSAFQGSVDPEHKYATLERAESENGDVAPDGGEESMSDEVNPDQSGLGVDSPTGIREPPYAEPLRLMPSTSSCDEGVPTHTYTQPDKSRKSLPLDEEELEAGDMPNDYDMPADYDGSTAV